MFFLLFACSKKTSKPDNSHPDISELDQHQEYFLDASQTWGLTAILQLVTRSCGL